MLFKIALVLIRNLIPVAGFVAFDWPVTTVVLLGAFNVGVLFTSSAAFLVALPRLPNAEPGQLKPQMVLWAILTVCATWATVFGVAYLTHALELPIHHNPGRTVTALDAGFLLAGVSLSITAAHTFYDRLNERFQEQIQEVRRQGTWIPGVAASIFLSLILISMEGWVIWLLVFPLAPAADGDDLGPALAVTIVTGVSLFLDAFLTAGPAKRRLVQQ